MDRLFAWENAGNGIKTAGPATLTNSIVNGYCNNWAGFPIAGNDSSGVSGTMCRADGTAVVMEFAKASNETVTLAYNTITGDGDTLFVGGGSDAGVTPGASDVVNMDNNIWLGQTSVIPRDGGAPTALDWYSDGSYAGTVNYIQNIMWNLRSNFCASGNVCKDPQLQNETLSAFDADLLTSSPAIGNANTSVYSVAWDFYGYPRSTTGPLDIGAVANRGTPFLGSGGGDSPLPPSNGGTQSSGDAPLPVNMPSGNMGGGPSNLDPGTGLRVRMPVLPDGDRYIRRGSTLSGVSLAPSTLSTGAAPVVAVIAASNRPVAASAAEPALVVPPQYSGGPARPNIWVDRLQLACRHVQQVQGSGLALMGG